MPDGKPVDVNDSGFKEAVLGSELPVVIEFWSPECIHCQRMANTVNALAAELGEKVRVLKVNVLENPDSPKVFNVSNIPAFFHVSGGYIMGSTVGAMSKGKLKKELGLG
jgi:thioredoxin